MQVHGRFRTGFCMANRHSSGKLAYKAPDTGICGIKASIIAFLGLPEV